MKPRTSFWQGALLLVLCAAAIFGFLKWRSSRDYDAARLVETLPRGGSAVVYLDFATLRSTGLLDALAGSKAAEESDYRKFVQDSGFDYRSDMEAVCGGIRRRKHVRHCARHLSVEAPL